MRSNIPRPRGGVGRTGSNRRTASVTTRIPWDLLARLQARAAKLGIERSEAIRRACADWVASEPEIRPIRDIEIDLGSQVAVMYGITRAEARVAIRLGQVTVDGEVERRLTIPLPGPGVALAIKLER